MRQVLDRVAAGLQVAEHRDREHGRRAHRAVGHLELAGQAGGRAAEAAGADAAAAALAVGDQDGVAEPLVDRRRRMADVQHEGAAADAGAVGVGRRDAHVVGELDRADAGGGDAVDVRGLQAAVGHGVQRRVGVQADHRDVGDLAHLGGLGGADDRDGFLFHAAHAPRRFEEGQRDVVVLLGEGDLQRHVELQRLGRLRAADDVGHHLRALGQLHHRDGVGLGPHVGARAHVDDVGPEHALAAGLVALDLAAAALGAEGPGREIASAVAVGAALQAKFARLAALPEMPGLRRGLRQHPWWHGNQSLSKMRGWRPRQIGGRRSKADRTDGLSSPRGFGSVGGSDAEDFAEGVQAARAEGDDAAARLARPPSPAQ